MAFLQRLKGIQTDDDTDASEEVLKGVIQLEVDLYQTDEEIIVFAPIAGARPEKINISIKGDDDVVIISGTKERPEDLAFNEENKELGTFFTEEVVWGDFYRKIILPERVNIDHAKAKIKTGVLVLHLPLITAEEHADKAVKLKVVDVDEFKEAFGDRDTS